MKILVIGDFHGRFSEKLKKEARKADLILSLGDYAGIDEWRPYLDYCFKCISKLKKPTKSLTDFFGEKETEKMLLKDDLAGRKIIKELEKLKKPTLFLFANGDDRLHDYPFDDFFEATKENKQFLKKIKGLKDITYGKKKINNIWFIGFGGFMDAKANYKEKSKNKKERKAFRAVQMRTRRAENKFFSLIKSSKGEKVFVLHYPPRGFFDKIIDKKNPFHGKSVGVEFFTKAIKKYQPKLVLCGHMHEYQDQKKLGKSLIINPGAAYDNRAAVIDWPSLNVRFLK